MPGSPPTTTRSAAPLAAPFSNILDMIGNTPMLELSRLDTGPGGCRLFAKLEHLNPAGSIKDRIGLSMIEGAEKDGRLNPKGNPPPTIIEATAGNTGLGLALVARQRGYTIKVVVPDKMSQEKIQHLRAMGAEVILTRSDVEKGHPEYYQDMAAALAKRTPNSLYTNQFGNLDNPRAHYETTGPEIWQQMSAVGGVDAVVCGVGSGGTLSGLGRYLKEKNPNCKVVLADPAGSILGPLVREGKKIKPGSWLVEGMGEDFVPDICDLKLIDDAVTVSDAESFFAARELLAKEGVLSGSSSGCILHAALVFCRKQARPMNVVTLVCDSGAKYLSKMFNDFWMMDNGFIKREKTDDLRDLIARRHDLGEDFTLADTDPIRQAIKRMQMYGVSQMVVTEAVKTGPNGHSRVVGILDEGDILLGVHTDPAAFERPVSDFMTRRVETISPEAPVSALMPIFRADRVAIVVDKHGKFYGLITKIDMINYLRSQLIR
ncbi:MAG TPA: cystathionine beta-synthase [Phycisphaerales bacterium]|jgi:cystathionine beta-synthase|nr:cystathionine beta-synthase [Phycisphaerales bacterium]